MRAFVFIALLLLVACQGTTSPVLSPDRSAASVEGGLNAYRAAANVPPVTRDHRLDRAARSHAADMARHGFMDHRGSDGSTHATRIRRSGYPYCGAAENVAKGPFSHHSVMAAWWGSPKHRSNMVLARVEHYGLAQVGDAWVLVLARSC
ncbi:Cysteine-rich secretory protein family protein [Palleronia aestuarii]|uniref:Cysteine-rich secretory protein family protein n=2 Tax=Palleronia aestuarii TaxID=568105 RepID=A0A2W7NEU4_9RHOB|nr:Cysteine-rich secretory protein family protein [Palleronia aestuarii]